MSHKTKVPGSSFGTWKVYSVSYDGTQQYGIWRGEIADIAMYIINIAYPMAGSYIPLTFEAIDVNEPESINNIRVAYNDVRIKVEGIGSHTDMGDVVAQKIKDFIALPYGSPFKILIETGSEVTLHYITDKEKKKAKEIDQILSKLSPDEEKLLRAHFAKNPLR